MAFKQQLPVILTTARLRLRPFRNDDWRQVHIYASDPKISRFQGWGPNSERDTKEFVKKCISETKDPSKAIYYFSISRMQDDQHIGGCIFSQDERDPQSASIGYTVAQAEWNKGYASEAAAAVLKFGFEELRLSRIKANCDADNVGSWKVMEKLGMHLDNVIKHAKFSKGVWRDWYEYSITAEEWQGKLVAWPQFP